MHGGSHQPNNDYVIRGNTMYVLDSFKYLNVMRSANNLHDDQCSATAVKASKVAGAIKHLFQQNTPRLLWPAFTRFVIPTLSYGMQVLPCQRHKHLSVSKDALQKVFTALMFWIINLDFLTLKHLACRNIAHTPIWCSSTRHCMARSTVSLKILGL